MNSEQTAPTNHKLAVVASNELLADLGSPCCLYDQMTLVVEDKRDGEDAAWIRCVNYREDEIEKARKYADSAAKQGSQRGWKGVVRIIRVRFEVVEEFHTANPTGERTAHKTEEIR